MIRLPWKRGLNVLPNILQSIKISQTSSCRQFSCSVLQFYQSQPRQCNGGPILQIKPITIVASRNYAKKKKDKKAGGGGKKSNKAKVSLSNEEISEVIDIVSFNTEIGNAFIKLKKDYEQNLSLRTSIASIDRLSVHTEDGTFMLMQLAQITQKNPHLVVVNMATNPQYIPVVKEALSSSGMNLNPQQDANTLFLPIPKVTTEHREQLAKNAKVLADKTKTKLRHIQNDYVRKAKKGTGQSEDLVKNVVDLLMATTQDSMSEVDSTLASKQKELLDS
ncbi:unnamed protein product [Owenia fusiformis]|uniref:Ribosome-recycling factor, mitochondrial n=1 Tax=Owenia fusiformis TaxID=6347 RepID=A0A8J1TZQ5_OWEFU|nr:unnamed protein product [Owenia fusiformis]